MVRALVSSELAEKYNILAEKKNAIADLTLQKCENDIQQEKQLHALRVQQLQLDIELKKQKLTALRQTNM